MGQQEREKLATRIQKVFGTEEPPKNVVYDATYADAMMLERFLRGKRWTEITAEDVVRYKDDLSLLSREGFHYYFPAFFIAALRDPHKTDLLIDNILSQLSSWPWDEKTANYDDALDPFTMEEQSTVREFLMSYFDLFDEEYWHHDDEQLALLDKALKRWTRST